MNFAGRSGLAALCAVAALLLLPSIVSAHGGRDVGEYHFTVGFFVEPGFEGQKNGVDLRVATGDEEPVEGVQDTLQVEVTQGDQSITLPLRTVFGTPGRYTADFFPTVSGQYTFRFFGNIDDLAVDEAFTSEVDGFGNILPTEELQFPQRVASGRELQNAVNGATTAAADADDAASSAGMRANIALVLGGLGLVAGGGALAASLRKRA